MLRGRRYSVRPWVIIASASARTAKLVQVCRTIFAGLALLTSILRTDTPHVQVCAVSAPQDAPSFEIQIDLRNFAFDPTHSLRC